MQKNFQIIQDLENPETTLDILAEAIIDIRDAMTKLQSTKINRKTLMKLIQMNCNAQNKPTIDVIETILESLSTMEKNFLKK